MKCWLKENGKIVDICDLLVNVNLCKSRSEARRMIEQKAIKRIEDGKERILTNPEAIIIFK